MVRWLVSSPVDDFVIHFANGILERGIVRVHDVQFGVREVRTLPPPIFTSQMRFTCLSPITVSTHINAPGRNSLQYCRLENGFYEKVGKNTQYIIHPEEILADNFALVISGETEFATPEIPAAILQVMQARK